MSDAIRLRVNGAVRVALAAGEDTLLSVVRDQLGLTGPKRGCNQGVCGACTVLIDGAAARACLSLAADCQDAEIVTVEALEKDRIGAALQNAFAATGAVQCGFCTSGMLAAARQLLAENASPSRDEIRVGLSGNICRCSGYRKVIDAVEQAARELAE